MKKLVTSYTFVAASKTVQSSEFTSLKNILLITNVTDNIIIYNFADATKGGTFSGSTVTLTYDTSSMSNSDDLQIFIDDATNVTSTDGATAPGNALVISGVTSGGVAQTIETNASGHINVADGGSSLTVDGTVATSNLPSTVDTNSGNKSVSTLRTVLATDQPALTTAGLISVKTDQTTHGTTDLVAADITKIAGSAISQGNGTAASAIRVALPTDGTGVVGLNAGSNIIGKIAIDQTTNGTTNNVTLRDATYAKFVCDTSTLAANTVKTATLTVSGFTAVEIEICNVNGASTIYFTLDGTTPSSTNFSGVLLATPDRQILPCNGTPTLKLVSAGTPIWSATVRGV
jgi:hypothetical protein